MSMVRVFARAALAALVTATLQVVLVSPAADAADPSVCPYAAGTFYEWIGPHDGVWSDPANWTPPVGQPDTYPNDNSNGMGPLETQNTFVCIGAGSSVLITGDPVNQYAVQAFFLGSAASLHITIGNGLVAMGSEESYAASTSLIEVTSGLFGGEGRIRTRGEVRVSAGANGGASLASTPFNAPTGTTAGKLVVDTGGQLSFPNLGVNLVRLFTVEVRGSATTSSTGSIAANYGTRFDVAAGGTLAFTGAGGYYQGATEGFTDLSDLVNAGRIVKTGPGTTSVVDADYAETGAGELVVQSGTVAFPDGRSYGAVVAGGQSLSSGSCGVPATPRAPCPIETQASVDPQSISLRVPVAATSGTVVQLLERQDSSSSDAMVFDSDASATRFKSTLTDLAVLELRFARSRAPSHPLERLSVTNSPAGAPLPTCLGSSNGAPPLGQAACVDRRGTPTSSRLAGDYVVMVVRTTTTAGRSRWIVRRETRDLSAPTLTARRSQTGNLDGRIPVKVTSSEAGKVKATGTLKFSSKGQRYRFAVKTKAKVRADRRKVLTLRLTPAQTRRVAGATKGKATLTLTATDSAGNSVRMRVRLVLT